MNAGGDTMRRIVHATDLSSASTPAFTRAVALAKRKRADLTLLYVADPLAPMPDGYVSPPTYQQLQKSAVEYGRKGLARLVAMAARSGVRARAVVRAGTPWAEIVRASRALKPDLLVIGTHGRTGLSRVLVGSVASRVIGLASCPVLTVAARRKAA
jgi:nucleotide-binding universal stress UspA family protein